MSQELLTIVRSPHSPALPLFPSSKLLFINTPRGPLFILRLFSPPSSRLDLWLKIQNSPEIYTQCSVPEFVTRTAHYIRRICWIQAWIFASLMQGSGLVPQERRWLRPIFEMPWNLSSNGCISCVDSFIIYQLTECFAQDNQGAATTGLQLRKTNEPARPRFCEG